MSCKGVCIRYHSNKIIKDHKVYNPNQKRCSKCEIFINFPGIYCPCCNYKLRLKPKSKKSRLALNLHRY